MVVGIFGGSFNPIHTGHAILASYIRDAKIVDKVWFAVSPQNPLKHNQNSASFKDRVEMCKLLTSSTTRLCVCDIENELQPPYYTINTLNELKKRYPGDKFKLIIGSDNLQIFHKWKDYKTIIDNFGLIVYPRRGYEYDKCIDLYHEENIILLDAPIIEISSTDIRAGIADGKDMQYYIPDRVYEYIKRHELYCSNG